MALNIPEFSKTFDGPGNSSEAFRLEWPGLRLEDGQIVYLMGHNGSGKSILLHVLFGSLLTDKGDLLRVTEAEKKRDRKTNSAPIGFVRQGVIENLALDLSVLDNIFLRFSPRTIRDRLFPQTAMLKRANDVVANFQNLSGKERHLVRHLSVGQMQTLSFGLASINDPALMLLDEFLSAADVTTSTDLRKRIRRASTESGTTFLIASHDIAMALQDASRIIVLRRGRILADIVASDQTKWAANAIAPLLSGV